MAEASGSVRLAVVEDQLFTREVTINLLREHYGSGGEVLGFTTVEELLDQEPGRFDVVVLDLQLREGALQDRDAVHAVAQFAPVLVFSGMESGEALDRAHKAGAIGYVSKDTARASTLIEGVDAALSGEAFVDSALQAKIGASARKQLTPRQQEVLRLEALGCKAAKIAIELDPPLSEAGVRRHIERIVDLHPDCTKQADRVRLAVNLGLVTPWDVSQRYATPKP